MRLSFTDLSDKELLARIVQLAAEERQATALLIAHLAELDARRLYLAEGFSSLFAYCTEVLRLSEHAAYGRIEAARAARRFPVILEMLGDGSITLTTVGLLGPHLTFANHQELLNRAGGMSKRAVEEMLAELVPRPTVPTVIRRLPMTRSTPATSGLGGSAQAQAPEPVVTSSAAGLLPTPPPAPAAPPRGRPATVAPLAPQRYRVQFTASAETYKKLRQAQDLLRHQIPDGDLAQIVDRALSALLEQIAREKFAATSRPRGSRPRDDRSCGDQRTASGSRHVPAEVKRAVWLRDGGRCAFVGTSGRRCTATGFLEFHHVKPYAAGGEPTITNIQLRCRAHNTYEAELYFGPATAAQVREARAGYSVWTELTSPAERCGGASAPT